MTLGEKFRDLLLSSGLVQKNKLDAYVLDQELEKVMGEDEHGILLGYKTYNAMYEIEKYTGGQDEINALVILFLDDCDEWREEFELDEASIDVSDSSGCNVSLSILIPFKEPIYIHQDDHGPFEYQGEKYSLGTGEADVADTMAEIEQA